MLKWVVAIRLVFTKKDKQSFYFDSFCGHPDKFLRNPLPKPIIIQICKSQPIKSILCDVYCLHFYYLIERMD